MFSATLTGVDESLTALRDALDESMRDAVQRAAQMTATAASADHPYTDHTDQLTESIEGLPAFGSATENTLRGAVIAGMFYGGFVDEGTTRSKAYPFLLPAFQREDSSISQILENALANAARRASWSP